MVTDALPIITTERVRWFADYFKKNPNWGVFLAAGAIVTGDDDVREAARWFNGLSQAQRRRLRMRAEDLANTVVRR